MLFQIFDDKAKCALIYVNGKFSDGLTPSCVQTWAYMPYMKEKNDIEYAQLYALGKTIDNLCSDTLKAKWEKAQTRAKAILKASHEVGLNLNNHCVYDLLPRHILIEIANIKNEICRNVFKNYKKPVNYDHLLKINKMISDIKTQKLNLDLSTIVRITIQDKNTYKLISESQPYIDYDMFKTVTGRLSTKKGSFPIMTLAKKYRRILLPNNNWLFEMDFNACELRTALALLGHRQPEEDLHDWNLKHVFKRAKSRDNAKKRIFSWLYNPNSKDEAISKVYDREKLKSLYFKDNKVITPFGREIECDEGHAISYLVQSTAADMVFEQMYKVWEFLKDKKSFIKFCNHDSVMIDLHTEQEYEFNEIKELFSNTRFGKFKVNCLGGKNWAEMKDLYIK